MSAPRPACAKALAAFLSLLAALPNPSLAAVKSVHFPEAVRLSVPAAHSDSLQLAAAAMAGQAFSGGEWAVGRGDPAQAPAMLEAVARLAEGDPTVGFPAPEAGYTSRDSQVVSSILAAFMVDLEASRGHVGVLSKIMDVSTLNAVVTAADQVDHLAPTSEPIRAARKALEGPAAQGRRLLADLQRQLELIESDGSAGEYRPLVRFGLIVPRHKPSPLLVGPTPAYWHGPTPQEYDLETAHEFMHWMADSEDLANDVDNRLGSLFLKGWSGAYDYGEKRDILRSIYFLFPDLAGAIIAGMALGEHSNVADLLGRYGGHDAIDFGMLGDMLNRGLSLFDKDRPMFDEHSKPVVYRMKVDGRQVRFSGDLFGLLGVIGYWHAPGSIEAVLARLSDENLVKAVDAAVDSLFLDWRYQERRPAILSFLKRVPHARMDAIQVKLKPRTRLFLARNGNATLPNAPAPTRVLRDIPRKIGVAEGPLYIVRSKKPDVAELRRIPRGSVVMMEYMTVEDARIPEFAAIFTYIDEGKTSHAENRAQHQGIPHALLPGPSRWLPLEGRWVRVEVTQTDVSIDPVETPQGERPLPSRSKVHLPAVALQYPSPIVFPRSGGMLMPEVVGFKAARLNTLAEHGIRVSNPKITVEVARGAAFPFSALGYAAAAPGDSRTHKLAREHFREYRKLVERDWSSGVERKLRRIRQLVSRMTYNTPIDIFPDPGGVREFLRGLWTQGVFIRSTANAQDLDDHPGIGAGVYATVPNVKGERAFWAALAQVRASVWSEKAYYERASHGVDQRTVHSAEWLLPSIDADYSFAMQTSDVSLGAPNNLVIEVVQGLGESLLSSEPRFAGRPAQIIVDKADGHVVEWAPSEKKWKSVLAEQGGTAILPTDSKAGFYTISGSNPLAETENQGAIVKFSPVKEQGSAVGDFNFSSEHEPVADALLEVGEQVETASGRPQDVEGVIRRDRRDPTRWIITLVQTRPL